MNLGFWGDSGVVGLELDTGMIRAVEMKWKSGRAMVVAMGHVAIPDSALADGVIQEVETVADALVKLWASAGFSSRNVVLGMYNQGVIMRVVNFPKVPMDKLDTALRLQAGEYFPIPLSQMNLYFAVIGEIDSEEGAMYEVLLVAVKKMQLELGIRVLEKGRLTARVVDASPLALLRAIPDDKRKGTMVAVDLSLGTSHLTLAVDGVPRFFRVMPVSLRQYRNKPGVVPVGRSEAAGDAAATGEASEDAFQRWGLTVAREIRTSISYYMKQDSIIDVSRVVLSGRGARVVGLTGLLQEELDVPVEVIDPLTQVKVNVKSGNEWKSEAPAYAVCIGLALRGLEV